MKIKFLHLGIACDDIAACKDFIKSAMEVVNESETVFDENQNASVCVLTLSSGAQLELITGPIVANFIKKGITYYHTCYGVQNIETAVAFLKREHKASVISEIKPGKLFNGRRAVFLYAPIGIIELLEDKQ
ncbi:MAG: Lactoylglutathione lyase [Candidatus Giovannonibacteria bacterium GW2011_GWB1_46_20]|uniref:Lactoylglutathione lyase n=1 Tax=Candidatus Giovannonibacteria bacterium GW2011_GWA1_44_25 TaxID=1618645 RepID=A0A0G1ILT4_9BACT|nr:MAG: Lactoylglutathione lyase [Parcubacteria group bacterium GW2011_GWC1_44_10]KKT60381.1 MAG: Lactoylglutathione lyase [Candidatus Giovannonibacteria bacterium GW2011_GWA1_44_25]KKU30239.1 MAG: Lactoylglutathione lyase [Candidatus Giovannonibacteria bacterium GW2011_GWB1_46_20]